MINKFLAEILEQPRALQETLEHYTNGEGKYLLDKVKQKIKSSDFEQIIFTGMGSSYFISHAAANIFGDLGMSSFVVNASELLHYNRALLERKTILVCFSQSGESFEVRELLNQIQESVWCIGITNEAQSTLAHKADIVLESKAGKEEMTSTKTYVCTTLVAFILGWHLQNEWNDSKVERIYNLIANFEKSLININHDSIREFIEFLGDLPSLHLIARGPSFSTACQSGLMFKEATSIAATGILGGEFRHGPMEMVKEGFKSVVFAPKGKTFVQSIRMAQDIAHFGGKVLLITNANPTKMPNNIMPVYIEEKDEYLFSIQSIIPIQLFIDSYAKMNGYEAGSFSHGSKVTMVE